MPILKEISFRRLLIIGTGFYIARYGLFLSAAHVLQALADWTTRTIGTAFICHFAGMDAVHFRHIKRVSLLTSADLAVGQADNYVDQYPDNPLRNVRAVLTTELPLPGTELITYAYPENEVLDFNVDNARPLIAGNYFTGTVLRHVVKDERPFIRYPHFETTIQVRSGASGGPVFDPHGRVVGVNCRGWDFGAAVSTEDQLSSISPVRVPEILTAPFPENLAGLRQ